MNPLHVGDTYVSRGPVTRHDGDLTSHQWLRSVGINRLVVPTSTDCPVLVW